MVGRFPGEPAATSRASLVCCWGVATDEQLVLTLSKRVAALLDQEAQLLSVERVTFLRSLIHKGMGKLNMKRAPGAPKPHPLLEDQRCITVARVKLSVTREQNKWLERVGQRAGGLTKSQVVRLLLLDWVNVDPSAAQVHD